MQHSLGYSPKMLKEPMSLNEIFDVAEGMI
jgi:hypothetical protein